MLKVIKMCAQFMIAPFFYGYGKGGTGEKYDENDYLNHKGFLFKVNGGGRGNMQIMCCCFITQKVESGGEMSLCAHDF